MSDEPVYTASPAMFRAHPIRFCLGLIILVSALTAPPSNRPDDVSSRFITVSVIGLVYAAWWGHCRTTRLIITPKKVMLRKGLLGMSASEIRISDVRNVTVNQGPLQAMFGVGSVGLSTSGQSGVEITAKGFASPWHIRDLVDHYRG
jgi:membrane protein YdbS with pleckstrin-like domain